MPQTSERIKNFGESVIRRMTRIANQYQAINLSQGFPDFDPPEELLKAGERSMREGPHQYAVTWGSPAFRKAYAKKQGRFMGLEIDPDTELTVCCGSTEAMMAALMTVCNPGDKVVVFSPFYENYGADTLLCGAVPVFVPLSPVDFSFDPQTLAQAFRGAKALILCNPSNPAGKVFSREELSLIAKLALENDAFVITDEVYEHIVYKPFKHEYLASYPGMRERTISCSSLSKTYSITGWRLGTIFAAPEITAGLRKVHDFLTVGAAAPLQEAALAGLELPDSYYEELGNLYSEKRSLFLSLLDKAGLPYRSPQGAYYVLADIGAFQEEARKKGYGPRGKGGQELDDVYFAEWLTRRVGVAAVPGSSFFREPVHNLIRFHFAKRPETLKAAGERLLKLGELWEQDHA